MQTIGTAGEETTYALLPWRYEANWSKDPGLVLARNLSLNVIAVTNYAAGDKLTLKIYVDGKLVNQTPTASNGLGLFLTYNLQ